MLTEKEINEIARLDVVTNLSNRAMGRVLKKADTTVGRCKKKLANANLTWPDTEALFGGELQAKIYPTYPFRGSRKREPDLEAIDKAMQYSGQRIYPLYMDYWRVDPETALGKTEVYRRYRLYRKINKLSMKMEHRAGEILFVDYAGTEIPYYSIKHKARKKAQIFVGVLGCSQYFYAHATDRQTTECWLEGQIAMLEHCGGVPEMIVPDNPKAVMTQTKPERIININYETFGKHYKIAIVPARPAHPQDKSLVEQVVGFIKDRILIAMKQMQFFSLEEINVWLKKEVDKLNSQKFQKRNVTRKELFEKFDKPLLSPLPEKPFEIITSLSRTKVSAEGTIYIDEHHYSVPHQLSNTPVEIRVIPQNIYIYHSENIKPICTHERKDEPGGQTIRLDHLPQKYRSYQDKTLEYYWAWAEPFGQNVQQLMAVQFKYIHKKSRLANIACREIQKLSKKYDLETFQSACTFATKYQNTSVTTLKNILASKVYKEKEEVEVPPSHANVRGSQYYISGGQNDAH
jgi:hypothetical protein